MVFHIRPLDLDLNFEKRDYSLGDTVDLTVDLRPRADTGVRGGRVDLVCEEKYVQTSSSFIPDTYSPQTAAGLVISGKTSHIAEERKERFVHSSVVLLDETTLPGGETDRRTVRLRIEPTHPPHLAEAWALQRDANSAWSFKWTLVVTVDVVRGRNPKVQRAVKVTLPSKS